MTLDLITTFIVDRVLDAAGVALDGDQDLWEEVPSLVIMELVVELESRWDVAIPEHRLSAARTVEQLASVVLDLDNANREAKARHRTAP
jgi:acyl carrier protein